MTFSTKQTPCDWTVAEVWSALIGWCVTRDLGEAPGWPVGLNKVCNVEMQSVITKVLLTSLKGWDPTKK